MPAFSVRSATEADFDEMLDLFDRVAAERLWIGTEPGFNRELYRKNWALWLHDPGDLFLVAECDGGVVGLLIVHPHIEFGPTLGMLVDERYRQRGIGRAILERCLAWARARNLAALHLLVFPHNAAAINLYRALGFEEIERFARDVTRADGTIWDTILMRATLR
jgi:putative acetyltransferase